MNMGWAAHKRVVVFQEQTAESKGGKDDHVQKMYEKTEVVLQS